MLAILITAIVTFLIAGLFGYVVHRALHQTWAGKLNQKHMTHHLTLYPPEDYTSEVYREAGADSTVVTFAIAAIPVVATPIILGILGILPLSLVITSVTIMALMSFLHDYLHDAFHIKNHWIYRIPGLGKLFAHWVHLHWLHHVDMSKNYGIFLFFLDRLFGTFWITK